MAITVIEALAEATSQKKQKVTFEQFGEALGVTRQYIHQIKDKLLNDEQIAKLEQSLQINLTNASKENNYISLPVRGNIAASLGQGIEVFDETKTGNYYISPHLMRDLGINPNYSEMVPAEGDSMLPTIIGGSLLLVDHSKKEVIDGKIYCVRLNNMLMAKRLQFLPPNTLMVISDNPKYKPFEVNLSKELEFDFAIIGEVRWWASVAR